MEDHDDWPRDVMVDLMMHLTRAGYPQSTEMLADALIVFESERSEQRMAAGTAPSSPVLRVVSGGEDGPGGENGRREGRG